MKGDMTDDPVQSTCLPACRRRDGRGGRHARHDGGTRPHPHRAGRVQRGGLPRAAQGRLHPHRPGRRQGGRARRRHSRPDHRLRTRQGGLRLHGPGGARPPGRPQLHGQGRRQHHRPVRQPPDRTLLRRPVHERGTRPHRPVDGHPGLLPRTGRAHRGLHQRQRRHLPLQRVRRHDGADALPSGESRRLRLCDRTPGQGLRPGRTGPGAHLGRPGTPDGIPQGLRGPRQYPRIHRQFTARLFAVAGRRRYSRRGQRRRAQRLGHFRLGSRPVFLLRVRIRPGHADVPAGRRYGPDTARAGRRDRQPQGPHRLRRHPDHRPAARRERDLHPGRAHQGPGRGLLRGRDAAQHPRQGAAQPRRRRPGRPAGHHAVLGRQDRPGVPFPLVGDRPPDLRRHHRDRPRRHPHLAPVLRLPRRARCDHRLLQHRLARGLLRAAHPQGARGPGGGGGRQDLRREVPQRTGHVLLPPLAPVPLPGGRLAQHPRRPRPRQVQAAERTHGPRLLRRRLAQLHGRMAARGVQFGAQGGHRAAPAGTRLTAP
ncbi:putative Pyrophosphate-energized proton pump [Actinacidiphila bryophytorum]|uniref:Pyrophosphate-energized proton pump n=1 Tax=Actinacidiphila bryophytorum TaxID=1436133 RepID=A0A9W4H0C8_9ACTN|nr:putative Pyrophosphate-energized proton pump [Actinacidiphila bryophytorum]